MSTIAQKLNQIIDIKDDIRAAINEKGVEVIDNLPFYEYADKIRDIQGGGTPEDLVLDMNLMSLSMTSDDYTDNDGNIYKTTASSQYSGISTAKPYMPFNGEAERGVSDCWHPVSGAPQWLQLELSYPSMIKVFTIYNRKDYVDSPKEVIFQGSNDGATWQNIYNFTFPVGKDKNYKVITSNAISYKYYRWYEESVNMYGVISKIIIEEAYRLKEKDNRQEIEWDNNCYYNMSGRVPYEDWKSTSLIKVEPNCPYVGMDNNQSISRAIEFVAYREDKSPIIYRSGLQPGQVWWTDNETKYVRINCHMTTNLYLIGGKSIIKEKI